MTQGKKSYCMQICLNSDRYKTLQAQSILCVCSSTAEESWAALFFFFSYPLCPVSKHVFLHLTHCSYAAYFSLRWSEVCLVDYVCFTALLFSDVYGISLTSSPAEVKTPGASVKLSCQISGYALTDYGTGWIRQPPGKGLEWIGIIWGNGGINSGGPFKTRFSISRDTSKNVL